MFKQPVDILKLSPVPLNVLVCCVYSVTAWLSQQYAIDPGNVTPVWLPSGLMLAVAIYKGKDIAYGVFFGAVLGNIRAYLSHESALPAIAAAMLNGLGDVIAIIGMAALIRRYSHYQLPLESLKQFALVGALGALAGGFISAMTGATGLLLFSFIHSDQYYTTLLHWWVGDGVGVVLFTPLVLALFARNAERQPAYFWALSFSCIVFCLFTAFIFDLVTLPMWLDIAVILCLPIAFSLTLQLGQVAVHIAQIAVAAVAIYATDLSLGPFAKNMTFSPLLALQLFIGLFSCVIVALALTVRQKQRLTLQLRNHQQKLESLYRHDPLTKLWNRYAIEEALNEEMKRFDRHNDSFAVFILDLDNFKHINDEYGHLEGDRVLAEFARCISDSIRDDDFFGRWGGEEFVLISQYNDMASATLIANKLVERVREHEFHLPIQVTVSIGFTTSLKNENQQSLLMRADEALYQAKNEGKDRAMAK